MDGGFVGMVFGFCASVTTVHGEDVANLGYIKDGECIVQLVEGDTEGQMATIKGHEIGIQMIEDGAVIHIDDLLFVVPKAHIA